MILSLLLLADHFEVPALDPDADAKLLAARVLTRCGNPYVVAELAFTFVVEADGVEKARRRHVWRPRERTVDVTWAGGSVHLESIQPFVASTAPKEQAIDAFSWFINDSYWLLAPCKVMDAGVEQGVTVDGRLYLQFSPDTGLTPGDQYWLRVDEEGVVTEWEYLLQHGGHGRFAWDPPQRFGPLELSTRRSSQEGDFTIRFEEISIQ